MTEALSTHPPASIARRAARAVGVLLIGLLMLGMSGWGVLALHYWDHANATLRDALAAALALASLAFIVGFSMRGWRWRSLAAFTALFGLLLSAWSTIAPSNDRAWEPENAVLADRTLSDPDAHLQGSRPARPAEYRDASCCLTVPLRPRIPPGRMG